MCGTEYVGYSIDMTSEIQSLPFLGTTWAERGPRYWFRRALISIGFAAICFFFLVTYVGIAYGLLKAVGSSGVGRICVVAVFVIGAV
jgi:hypothetical protein